MIKKKYLFISNSCEISGYHWPIDGSFIAINCTITFNEDNSPIFQIIDEEVWFLYDSRILDKEEAGLNFDILVIWDRSNLDRIYKILPKKQLNYNVVVLSELFEFILKNYVNSFEYNLCIFNIIQRKDYPSIYSKFFESAERLYTNDRLLDALQDKVQNHVLCKFNKVQLNLLNGLGNVFCNLDRPAFLNLDKLCTDKRYLFVHDLKILFFISRIWISSNLRNLGMLNFISYDRQSCWHLEKCTQLEKVKNKRLKRVLPVHYLFDGIRVCLVCNKKLCDSFVYTKTIFDDNEILINRFCSSKGFRYRKMKNNVFALQTNTFSWLLKLSSNNRVTNLYYKKNSDKDFQKQNLNHFDLDSILKYINFYEVTFL